jgi:TonB-linked SusC/RagA family outer membrane protein
MFWLWENTASYNRNIGKHDFAVVVGTSAQRNYGEQQGGTKRGIPADKLKDASLSFPVPQTNQFFWGSEYQETLASLFGRLNYNYDGKYLLTGVVRRDGSSRFGSNNKYGMFPSLSLGWVASRENFWSTNNPITFLKIRGSYGVNGNNQIGDFLYLSTVGGGRNYTMGGTLVNGVSPNAISNPDLKWEETSQANIGFDAVILKNINLTVDLYNKKTTGMLLGISVPGYVGNNGPTGNIADMENRGVEVELGYNNKIGKLNYNIKGNVTYLENEVTYLGADKKFLNGQTFGPQGVQVTRTQVGYPIGSFYGFKTNGLFQNNAELNAYVNKEGTLLQPNARPGDIRFVDINGDGQINNDDRTIIGNPTPDYTFGFTAAFSYSQFDMVVFGQGVAGNQVFQAIRRFDLPTSNWTTEAISRWTGEGTSTYFPRLVLNDPNQNFSRSSEFYLQDGSYFRFKTVQLGYTNPNHLTQKKGLNNVRIYVTGNNLLTFTNYNGFDPEIGGGSYGVDRGIYPQARAYLFGLNLGF